MQRQVVMTVAGSDSGGGAGIQADLKTFEALGVFGTSAITGLTAQNPSEVTRVYPVDPEMVAEQIFVIRKAYPIVAAKTGMLADVRLVEKVAEALEGIPALVVDPVIFSASGVRLTPTPAVDALCRLLAPKACLLTPNRLEAEELSQSRIAEPEDYRRAAEQIGRQFGVACVVKGARISAHEMADYLWWNGEVEMFNGVYVDGVETHGTGCSFSAAIAAYLARGLPLNVAISDAKRFVGYALQMAHFSGGHTPLNFHDAAMKMAGGKGESGAMDG